MSGINEEANDPLDPKFTQHQPGNIRSRDGREKALAEEHNEPATRPHGHRLGVRLSTGRQQVEREKCSDDKILRATREKLSSRKPLHQN